MFTNSTEAATKRKTVKEGMVTYTIYEVNHYFTKSQVKNIVNQHKKMNNSVAKTIKYIISVHPLIGFMVFAEDLSTSSLIKTYQKAASQNKGVRVKYDYWLGNTSHSVFKIKNKSVKIE